MKLLTKSCTSFCYQPRVYPYVNRVYALTVQACRLDDGSRALKVIPGGNRSKAAMRAADHGVDVQDVIITEDDAADYQLASKVPGRVYFDRVFGMLENRG